MFDRHPVIVEACKRVDDAEVVRDLLVAAIQSECEHSEVAEVSSPDEYPAAARICATCGYEEMGLVAGLSWRQIDGGPAVLGQARSVIMIGPDEFRKLRVPK